MWKDYVNANDAMEANQRRLLWYIQKRGGYLVEGRYWNNKTKETETAKASVVPRTLLDYYVEALRMQEQEKMPEVGYCMDRRTGQHLLHYCNDTHVHSLICFVCA